MAISGNGTQGNPYIVDNWPDFLTCLGQSNAYIKWADSATKVLSEVTIASEISVLAQYVDFNGWTISNLYITKPFSSSRPFIVQAYRCTVYNLTVEYMNWNNPRQIIGTGVTFYNCFFDNITVQELPSGNNWWLNGQSESQSDGQTGIFTGLDLYNCIIHLNTQDANIIIPNGVFHSCEIYCNYKYTLDNAVSPTHGIFMRRTYLYNSYVSGKIDVSGGTGHFDIVRANNQTELQSGGVVVQNSIINIETKISDPDCYVSETHARTWEIYGTGKSFFVTNNGNNYTYYNGTVSSLAKGLLSDLRNSDELTIEGVIFMEDDETRYPQYALDNSTKDWTFRKNVNVNTGIPFLPFWKYPTYEPPTPPEGSEVYENPYLTVYDMETKQDNFDNHGLAILCPTSGRIVEELNGEYSLSFTHPRDTDNKWQYVLEMNVVKALGQLFVIQKVDEVQSGGSGYVSAYAEHITYTLNDKWIFPPVTIAGYNGQALIDSIMQQATDLGYDWQTTYDFDVTTDLNAPEGFRDWYEMSEGVTPYEMLIGGNGFVAKLGGELYRDNFHMSINSRMEGARDNAFELAIGYNLTGIKRTVDLTTFCTYLRGYDVSNGDYDNWFAVGWDPSTLPRPYPREVVRSTNFYFDHPEYAEEGQLERETMLFFNQNCAPLVSYELNVVDLRRNPDYKMFSNNYRFKVGDKGRVWDERLQAWLELEITRTEHDIITGDCVKVVIGTQRSFTRPVGYQPVITRGIIIPAAEKVLEGLVPLYFNSAADKLIDWTIYGAEGGVSNASPNGYIIPVTIRTTANYATADEKRYHTGNNIAYSVKYGGIAINEYTGYMPITFVADGTSLIDWYIKGNSVQNGTPTRSNPVDVVGLGTLTNGQYIIPVSSAGQTTNIPIFEATRRIKKLVFDGTEDTWYMFGGSFYNEYIYPDYLRTEERIVFCTHYQGIDSVTSGANVGEGECAFYSPTGYQRLYIHDSNYETIEDFKAYLAQQYANGTPVCVWYVLAEPETVIANEPLMGIGEYADTLTMTQADIEIPTTNGSTTIDINATVRPSEVYIKWHGHEKVVYIPIDHPLEDGESISRADTGIDIPTFIGDNTLDTDTTVKPRMKIIYKEG